ncbi:MAG TPA: serine hydrolase [Blastocatellia bacterium]|nr:serine hydrolase [Blastocatellia bacterium]
MRPDFNRLSEYLQAEIREGQFPGAQYLIGQDRQVVEEGALGFAVVEPERIPTTADTVYDLASLTKPLITSLLAVRLAERGEIDLDAPLKEYLVEFKDQTGDKGRITLTQLLTHTSGFAAWRPLYLETSSKDDIPAVIARMPIERSPDGQAKVIYSDLNFVLLGCAIERLLGRRLDHIARAEIIEPLGLRRTMFNPPPSLKRETAATEWGQAYEGGEAYEAALLDQISGSSNGDSPHRPVWRTDLIWGEVHDGNAYFMGGVAGHAGLFSTAREVFRLANQFLSGSELLSDESLPLFSENFTRGHCDARSIGWMLAATVDCSAGPSLPPAAFGHTGFTGTSVWIDPFRQRVFVLLTNRVHPSVIATNMKKIRQRFHSLAVQALDHA